MNYLVLVLSSDKQDFVNGPQSIFICFGLIKQNTNSTKNLLASVGFELGSSDYKASTLTTTPAQRLLRCASRCTIMFLALKRRVRNIGPMKKLFQNERHRDVYLMSFAKQNFAQIFGNFLGYLKYIGFF